MNLIEPDFKLGLGDIVEIEGKHYYVAELPSCVNYQVGTKPLHYHRYYLHSVSGTGYYDYSNTIEYVRQKVKEVGGTVFKTAQYEIKLIEKTS